MRKLLQLMVLSALASSAALAAEYSLPFGLKWGMKATDVDKQLAGKLTFESSSTKKEMQMLGDEVRTYNGEIDGYQPESIEMEFLHGRLFGVAVKLPDMEKSVGVYGKFTGKMSEIYGAPKTQPAADGSQDTTQSWNFANDTIVIATLRIVEGEAYRGWMYVQPSKMKEAQKENAAWEEKTKKDSKDHDPEHVFKMKFCKNPNLLAVAFYSQMPIEHGCIYSLAAQGLQLTVVQSVPGGIIIGAQNGPTNGKSVFVATKKEYADGDLVQPQFVRSIGIKKFTTVLGAQRSVNAFQYLGDGVSADSNEE